jgi:cytochrome P450
LDRATEVTAQPADVADRIAEGGAMATRELTLPPGPTRAEFLRTYRTDPLGTLLGLARDVGDIVYLVIRRRDAFLLSHPDHAHEVLVASSGKFMKGLTYQELKYVLGDGLVTSEGEFHKRQRRLANPAMHHKRIEGYSKVMSEITHRIRDRWTPGEVVDVDYEMAQLALGVVCKTLFSVDLEEEDGQLVRESVDKFSKGVNFFITANLFRRMQPLIQAGAQLDALIYKFIADHRASGEDQGDLLSMLIMAVDEEVTGEQMTDQQVRDEAMTLIITGHETTASTLTWSLAMLAQHPEAEAKLHEELDRVLDGREPTLEDIPRLEYTHKVLQEALRLYPPGWMFERTALADVQFGDYTLPEGASAIVCPYIIHRDPRFWDRPLEFDPDRWTDEAESSRPRMAYFPFGAGPRFCYGEAFAWVEATLGLAGITQKWRLKLVEGQEIRPEPHVTIRVKGGLPMIPELREPA